MRIPKGITLHHMTHGLWLTRHWLSPGTLISGALLISLITLSAPLVWYILSNQQSTWISPTAIYIVYSLLLLGFGYLILAGLINKTHIKVIDRTVHIYHHPLPWPGGVHMEIAPSDEIHHKIHRSTMIWGSGFSHAVCIGSCDQGVQLLANIIDPEQAEFISFRLKRVLDGQRPHHCP